MFFLYKLFSDFFEKCFFKLYSQLGNTATQNSSIQPHKPHDKTLSYTSNRRLNSNRTTFTRQLSWKRLARQLLNFEKTGRNFATRISHRGRAMRRRVDPSKTRPAYLSILEYGIDRTRFTSRRRLHEPSDTTTTSKIAIETNGYMTGRISIYSCLINKRTCGMILVSSFDWNVSNEFWLIAALLIVSTSYLLLCWIIGVRTLKHAKLQVLSVFIFFRKRFAWCRLCTPSTKHVNLAKHRIIQILFIFTGLKTCLNWFKFSKLIIAAARVQLQHDNFIATEFLHTAAVW